MVALAWAMCDLFPGNAAAPSKVHVGKAQGTAWTFLPVDIGVEKGIFAKQDLDVDSADLGGDAKVQQAIAAGSIDFGLGSGPGMAFLGQGWCLDRCRRFRWTAAEHLGDRVGKIRGQDSRQVSRAR